MNNQLLFLQPGGVKVPVKLEIFKHGGGMYLAAVNHEAGVHVPFLASASVMAAELRRALELVEAANGANDQGHISRAGNGKPAEAAPRVTPVPSKPVLADFNGEPRHDWPLFVRKFYGGAAADVLPAIAHYYKKTFQYSAPEIDAILEAEERLELDFELCRPQLSDILGQDGRLKRGARARAADALGVKDAGNYRGRIDAVLGFILNNSEEWLGTLATNRPKPNEIGSKNQQRKYQKPQTLAS